MQSRREQEQSVTRPTMANRPSTNVRLGGRARRVAAAALALTPVLLGGCVGDSWFDQSNVGRWERTPTRVPILTSLALIEDPETELVEITDIQPADLLPEAETYRVGPGDFVNIVVWDIVVFNQPEFLQRTIDQAGYVEIPVIGQVYVAGLTTEEMVQAIAARMKDFVADPTVTVDVASRRSQTFHLLGAVQNPGPYVIPASDYRLLQALVAAGGFPEYVREVYVIRQVPLTPEAAGLPPETTPATSPERGEGSGADGDALIDLIEGVTEPEGADAERGSRDDGSPGVFGQPGAPEPAVDLLPPATGDSQRSEPGRPTNGEMGPTRWEFERGRWVRRAYARAAAPGTGNDSDGLAAPILTQRVIRVPIGPLVAGDASVNIVVRPGDVVRVPPNPAGNVYMGGEVAGPGVFNLPSVGRLTLTRAIVMAGGLTGIAVPERVDLTRVVGRDEQATIMLDLRAIESGAHPDVYLKPDDRINVGTNFWATPLAIIRNGFRSNYGFGFLLDRNFGNDVFGAPPTNNRF